LNGVPKNLEPNSLVIRVWRSGEEINPLNSEDRGSGESECKAF
jgi:hypothetical protein